MRKWLCLLLAVVMLFALSGCSLLAISRNHRGRSEDYGIISEEEFDVEAEDTYEWSDNDEDVSNATQETPSSYSSSTDMKPRTYMDLFKGGERLFFYIHTSTPRYDSYVAAVYVVKNGMVTEAYYNLNSSTTDNYGPFTSVGCKLQDFDGMSDAQILETVRSKYLDASKSYSFMDDEKRIVLSAKPFPYKIQYEGQLESSGNNLELETIYFFDDVIGTFSGTMYHVGVRSGFNATQTILPQTVRSKEYVGINSGATAHVTLNTYSEFGDLTMDSVSGARKVW